MNKRLDNVVELVGVYTDLLEHFNYELDGALERFKSGLSSIERSKGYEQELLAVATCAIKEAYDKFEDDLKLMTARDINMLYQPPTLPEAE
jgi:hypothetical protein